MRLQTLIGRAALLAAASFVASPSAAAQATGTDAPLRGVLRAGLEYGGEKIIGFTYEDGSTPDVTAGGGLVLTAGGVARVLSRGAHAVEAQVNAGIKWRTIPAATNQDANWLRFPVEGLLFYRSPRSFRVGVGAVVHLRNVLEASGEALDARLEFENRPGALLQAEYLRDRYGFDVRYTVLDYRVDARSPRIGASSIGVGASIFLGRGAR